MGGGVKNKIWITTISNVSNLNQELKVKTIGASYGNSFLAALALGDVEREDIYRWNPVKKVIKSHPDPIYTKQFELFKNLYKNISNLL